MSDAPAPPPDDNEANNYNNNNAELTDEEQAEIFKQEEALTSQQQQQQQPPNDPNDLFDLSRPTTSTAYRSVLLLSSFSSFAFISLIKSSTVRPYVFFANSGSSDSLVLAPMYVFFLMFSIWSRYTCLSPCYHHR
jgi:hypothetical protein